MTKLVRDLMHRGLLTCRPDATLGQVAVLLNQNHVHALMVTDRDGRASGSSRTMTCWRANGFHRTPKAMHPCAS